MIRFFLEKVYRYRLNISVQNMSRSFPHFSYEQISECTGKYYQNLSRIILEMIFPSITKLEITLPTIYKIKEAAKRDRPTILLLGHYGNWEVLNKLPKYTDTPVKAFYKPLRNNLVCNLMLRRRTRYGLDLINSMQSFRELLKNKASNEIILFVADQFPGKDKGITVNFLHQETQMHTGAEDLAKRVDAFVGYVELFSKSEHIWDMKIQTICENASLTDEGYITRTYASLLEESIYKRPAWWLWSHKRWK